MISGIVSTGLLNFSDPHIMMWQVVPPFSVTTRVPRCAYTIGCVKVGHLPPMKPMTLIQFAKCPVSHIVLAKAGQSLRWWPRKVWWVEPPDAQAPAPPATTTKKSNSNSNNNNNNNSNNNNNNKKKKKKKNSNNIATTTRTRTRSVWQNEKRQHGNDKQVVRIQDPQSVKNNASSPAESPMLKRTFLDPNRFWDPNTGGFQYSNDTSTLCHNHLHLPKLRELQPLRAEFWGHNEHVYWNKKQSEKYYTHTYVYIYTIYVPTYYASSPNIWNENKVSKSL